MKTLIGIILLSFFVSAVNGLLNGYDDYLKEVQKTQKLQKDINEQKGARQASIEYMNQIVELSAACDLLPFDDFCRKEWTNQTVVDFYKNQGIVGIPSARYYILLFIAFGWKALNYLIWAYAAVKAFRWANAPSKGKVAEAKAIIDKGEQWLKSIEAELEPEKEKLKWELALINEDIREGNIRRDNLCSANYSLRVENDDLIIKNRELRNQNENERLASKKLNTLFGQNEKS